MHVVYRCPDCSHLLYKEFSDELQSESVRCDSCDRWLGIEDIIERVTPTEVLEDFDLDLDTETEPLIPEASASRLSDSSELDANLPGSDQELTALETTNSQNSGGSFDWAMLNAPVRNRTREKSFLRKAIPPILGGLAAFPIATAIMWYGFGRDLGNVGPWVAQYVPWIVPEKVSGMRSNRLSRSNVREGSGASESVQQTQPKLPKLDSRSEPLVRNSAEVDERTDPESASNSVAETSVAENSIEPNLRSSSNASAAIVPPSTVDVVPNADVLAVVEELKSLRTQLYNADKDDKIPLLGHYFRSICRLSELTSSLRLADDSREYQLLAEAARDLLKDKNTSAVIRLGIQGEIPNVPAAKLNDFVVAMLEISKEDRVDSTGAWQLLQVWAIQNKSIPVEAMPDAWRGADQLPTMCLILGKLVESNPAEPQSGAMKLSAHAIIPL